MLNPEKSRRLRPVRIILAVLLVALFILVLDRLPTSRTVVKSTTSTPVNSEETEMLSAEEISKKNSSGIYFCTFTDLLANLEEDLESRLKSLGVPEEEYKNLGDYLEKDEIYVLELKTSLSASLELSPVRTTPLELSELSKILSLKASGSACTLTPPAEYKELSDLLTEYRTALTSSEDYDEAL